MRCHSELYLKLYSVAIGAIIICLLSLNSYVVYMKKIHLLTGKEVVSIFICFGFSLIPCDYSSAFNPGR